MEQKRKTYSKEEKLAAVKLYLQGELGYGAVALQLGIPDERQV